MKTMKTGKMANPFTARKKGPKTIPVAAETAVDDQPATPATDFNRPPKVPKAKRASSFRNPFAGKKKK